MKKFILHLVIFSFAFSVNAISDVKDCSGMDKLSKDYAKCLADKSKVKGSKIKKIIDNKLEVSGIKKKYKKLKNSNTLADLLK